VALRGLAVPQPLARAAKVGTRLPLVLVGASLALLLAAWIVATQPFAAPDEASHYLRALTVANGQLLGPKMRYPPVPGMTLTELAFVQGDTRGVLVPSRLSPPGVLCAGGNTDSRPSRGCIEATPTGDYFPPPYLLPALALEVSSDATSGLWLGRIASAVPCFAFIVLAFILLWELDCWSIVGLMLAVSPMVLFVGSILNPNGLEIAASLAFAAAVLRIARAPARAHRWVWVVLVISGAVTVLSWQVGPVFAIGDLLLGMALIGRDGLRALQTASGRMVRLAGVALLAACGFWLWYSRASGVSHTQFGVSPVLASLHEGLVQLESVLRDAVGRFGALTVHLPAWACWSWWLAVVAVVAVAAWLGNRRERVVIGSVMVTAFAFPVLAYAWFQRHSGFGMQGRYVLPVLMLIPLAAGEVIYRHRSRLVSSRTARLTLPVGIALIAAFQAYAWWFDARNAAGAPGTIRVWAHATWSPPLGWIAWTLAPALGAGALLAVAALQAGGHVRRQAPPEMLRQ